MPSYKTHSIHGELVISRLNLTDKINYEAFKTFCIGPDLLMASSPSTFHMQHEHYTKEYFETLINYIKDNKLYNDPEIMAFLYGQIDHYILDLTTHPYIYYSTEGLKKDKMIKYHGLVEMWIDDYISKKYNKNNKKYYRRYKLSNKELKNMINDIYLKVYNKKAASSFNFGIFEISLFDSLVRHNRLLIIPAITKILNIGDITYHNEPVNALLFVNHEKESWTYPETNQQSNESFEDLWHKSIERSMDAINDVNDYLFNDKPLNNLYLLSDLSYNTGIPCEEGQKLKYIKKY